MDLPRDPLDVREEELVTAFLKETKAEVLQRVAELPERARYSAVRALAVELLGESQK